MKVPALVAVVCNRQARNPSNGHPARLIRRILGVGGCFLLTSILTLPATAQLDTNSSGMGDVWERHFNRDNPGQLFDPQNPNHAPHADPDGDGWTNFQESIAGTDPFDAKPPVGIVATHVSFLKDQEEPPSPEFPEGRFVDVTIISWNTLPGKEYTLKTSPDLTAESWIAIGAPISGDGTPAAMAITLTDIEGVNPERLFWRVHVHDPLSDTDGDGLTDYEEFLLGSNPYDADTSGDGVPDGWLVVHGFDPNDNHADVFFHGSNVAVPDAYTIGVQAHPNASLNDFDGDGLTNAQEALLGTDPLVSDNPGILQGRIKNGDFSKPSIGSGERSGVNGARWDYWPGDEVDGWEADEGDHIEFQNLHSIEAGNAYAELRAHPAGHSGLKQKVGTRKGARYLLLFDCRAHPHIAPGESNFPVKIGDVTLGEVQFDDNTAWERRAFSFEAPDVITLIQFIPVENNHAAMGGFIDNVVLREMIVNDNITGTGVDTMSLMAEPEHSGYQPDYWIMAPQQGPPLPGGEAYENLTLMKMEQIPNTNAQLIATNATSEPMQIAINGDLGKDDDFHDVKWQGGGGSGVNDESRLKVEIDDYDGQHEVNVMIKTMKHRTVNVKAIRVQKIGHLLLGEGHPDGGEGIAPFPSLPLAEHQKRLMVSGQNYILGTSRLLVKAEWDKAEEWLIARPRGDH